jgi:formylglycine-generating enzyme required for sulfatase activity
MKKYYYHSSLVLILILALALSGCGSGGGGGGGTTTPTPTPPPVGYTPGQSSTCTVGGVSFNIHYVPAVASFPTGPDDSGTGSVSNAYWMAETEVTYQLWDAVYDWAIDAARGANQYYFQNIGVMGDGTGDTNQHPVTTVNWRDAIVWCNALTECYNAQNGTSLTCVYTYSSAIVRDSRDSNATACDGVTANAAAKGFRMPTCMERELAARYRGSDSTNAILSNGIYWTKGNSASGATADCLNEVATGAVAWHILNSSSSTHPVGQKTANTLNLYDISGNVWEWCVDAYSVPYRVRCGGGWDNYAAFLMVGYIGDAYYGYPSYAYFSLGFRPVRTE